jgi:hypothetical protein
VYGAEAVEKCLAYITENLPKAQQQPAQTLAQQKAAHNDITAHTDTPRLSCCSLAPKHKHEVAHGTGSGHSHSHSEVRLLQ